MSEINQKNIFYVDKYKHTGLDSCHRQKIKPTKNQNSETPLLCSPNCVENSTQTGSMLQLHRLNKNIETWSDPTIKSNSPKSKAKLAKLNWWNAPSPPPVLLTEEIKTAVAIRFPQTTTAEHSPQAVQFGNHCNIPLPREREREQEKERKDRQPLQQEHQLSPKYKHHASSSPRSKSATKFDYDSGKISENPFYTEENATQDSQLIIRDGISNTGVLNAGEEDEMLVTGYYPSIIRTIICWICICLTGGLLRLIMHWWRHWYLIATHTKCPLDEAKVVLIQEDYQGKHKIFYVKTVQHLSAENHNNLDAIINVHGDRGESGIPTPTSHSPTIDQNVAGVFENEKKCLSHFSVHFSAAHFKHLKTIRAFYCKQLRYVWDSSTQTFLKIKGIDVKVSCAYYHQQQHGLSENEQISRRLVYGENKITVPYKDIKTLLFLEVLNPFYVFQVFSVILWFTYDYYYYAVVILLMSIFGITMSVIQTKKNQDALRETVQNVGCISVLTDNGAKEMPTYNLVPGDIIEIPWDGCTMQCDAVLLSGNCILDESMLTGESIPVTKTPLPYKRDVTFDKKEHARHTLFCGTKVIQTRYIGSEKVLAIVINTGNITAKGGLIRSILYPPPIDYKFERDSYKFIECLGLIALIGFTYTLISKIMRDVDPVKIAVESLDLITIVVPPALPAAMTVGRLNAQKRLKKNNIYCISPRSINVAGSIDCCCFDKTGTLTEDGLDMWGVLPKSATNQFQIPIKQIDRLPLDHFLFGMVTCHSITIMNGKMMGDPLDLKMFESTGWLLEDPKDIPDKQKFGLIHPTIVRQPKKDFTNSQLDAGHKIERQSSIDDLLADVGLLNGETKNDHGIIREFPFTSNLQRMSVITRRLSEKNFTVYCKGSPEMMQQLCKYDSMPDNYSEQLAVYAKQGFRVIALSYKNLGRKINYTKVQRLSRESVESDLEFLGFVVLENRLKPDTSKVINILNAANIRTVMITGDNILTAISVARDCGIVASNQAVVTVNVRQRHQHEHSQFNNDEQQRNSTFEEHHNYELYYTLELGCKDGDNATANTPLVMNGNGGFIKATDKHSIDSRNSLNYNNIMKASDFQPMDGDVESIDSTSINLPNSCSMGSVETCNTWTHNVHDIELGLNQTSLEDVATTNGWRRNYRFAMVGKTWQIIRDHFSEEMENFLTRGSIFARMSPDQKQALIMELQSLDYSVSMCGDGANDCGALKVAHAGISLSETESSIASPFTSRNPTIASVVDVIKEGRAALVTSFGIFKYMAAYSMVQFISVMILYSIDSNLTDKQYLYIDLGLISVFAFFFGKTESYTGKLSKQVPLSSLISLTPLSSILLHLIAVVAFQVLAWFHLHEQAWFVPFKLSNEDHLGCYENYTMFAISSFQYIILAFVFSKSAPYRQTIWSNRPFCISLAINTSIVIYMVVYPAKWLADFFQLIVPPEMDFRYWMLVYGVTNFIIHVFIETVIVEYLLYGKVQLKRDLNWRTSKRKHMQIEHKLSMLNNWPEIREIYEPFESTQKDDLPPKPTYVEISAEQNNETAASDNIVLNSFFETPGAT